MSDDSGQRPDSLLPYDEWTEEAMRHVMVRALAYAAAKGLPGEHHFYLSFRTDFPGVVVPDRLRAQYPEEMTIVLQHQFWDLNVDEPARIIGVGLSFGGIPTTLRIPFAAVTQFVDPHIRYGLRFTPEKVDAAIVQDTEKPAGALPAPIRAVEAPPDAAAEPVKEEPQVVSLDAFRRRTPPRDN
jgi:uncharacterized protein